LALLYWGFCESRSDVRKLRISIVQYLNTAPLVRGFTRGALRGKYDLSFTVPSQCAEALRDGRADIAIIPAIEYQRIENLVVLPDIAIAAKRKVRSLLLISKMAITDVKRIALDSGSRSTQALLRILCADHWKIAPEFFEAALLIGEPALRLAMQMDGERQGEALGNGWHVYDMGEEWRRLTGLPAVLAVWAARPEVVTQDVLIDFAVSRDYGLANIGEISEEAAQELDLPAKALAAYLRENIDFSLDAENRKGLEYYFARAAALGLIERAKPVEWALSEKVAAR
jgi:chorismate dehydratase